MATTTVFYNVAVTFDDEATDLTGTADREFYESPLDDLAATLDAYAEHPDRVKVAVTVERVTHEPYDADHEEPPAGWPLNEKGEAPRADPNGWYDWAWED